MTNENRNIRPQAAEAVTNSLKVLANEYQQAGAGSGEIAAPMIWAGCELLLVTLGHDEGLKSIEAILNDFKDQMGVVQ